MQASDIPFSTEAVSVTAEHLFNLVTQGSCPTATSNLTHFVLGTSPDDTPSGMHDCVFCAAVVMLQDKVVADEQATAAAVAAADAAATTTTTTTPTDTTTGGATSTTPTTTTTGTTP